ncbi:MAG: hypothetical protein IJR18_01975 [Campylobacter sp.]|nr:hypothetical protein [Campylobacter sp.]
MNIIKRTIVKLMPKSFWDSELYLKYWQCFKNKKILSITHKHYESVIENFKRQENQKIRFASYIMSDSMFGAINLYELMLKERDKFDLKIVVVPDISRSKEHMIEKYNGAKNFVLQKYGIEMLLDGYDEKNDEFLDHSDKFDVVYCANPYDGVVNMVHSMQYLSSKNLLPFYIQYGFSHFQYGDNYITTQLGVNLCWKVFLNNKFELDGFRKFAPYIGKNAVVTGYAKMDSFKINQKKSETIKTILIASHRSTSGDMIKISNFLYYCDFILTLPEKFPNVRFVFRPHPVLFEDLVQSKTWSKEQVSEYLEKIKSVMEFSSGGDYLDIFNEADGIIHDCGSFISEWLYSGKKGCFVSYDGLVFDQLTEYGKIALSHYFIAKNETDIISYINDVIDEKTKPLDMEKIKDEIMLNYPNVSQKILDEIKQTLGVK